MKNGKIIMDYIHKNELNIKQIVNDYTSYLYTIIKNSSGTLLQQEDIEEIIYETFLIVWQTQNKLDIAKPLTPYLSGIAKNLIKKKYRRLKIDMNLDDFECILTSNIDIQKCLEEKEINKILHDEIDDLSTLDSSIFKMYYYSGKSTKEISNYLNMSDLNVRVKLHRIRKKLLKRLEENGYGENS